ncbi:MAG: hypothetical protein Q9182_002865 [Xanthomendoza sp. 2 TL-2023]
MHHTSSLILPNLPQTPPDLRVPPTHDSANLTTPKDLEIDQNIAKLLHTLSSQSLPIQFNQAKTLGISLTAGGSPPDFRRSSNIDDFRSIIVYFKAGGIQPDTPVSQQYFRVQNFFPNHWDQWGRPNFYAHPPLYWLQDRIPLIWRRVQKLMKVEQADRRLKEAGFRGEYDSVLLHETERGPLQYCFQGLWPGSSGRNVVVEVEMGTVREVRYSCVSELSKTTE